MQINYEPFGLHVLTVICFETKMLLFILEMSPNFKQTYYTIINVIVKMMMYISNIDIFLRILELTW